MDSLTTGVIVFGAGMIAGGMNSVAGGGSFIAFPALMLVGLPPIVANATNNLAMWVGTIGSLRGYAPELKGVWRPFFPSWLLGLAGGGIGAVLLLVTPETVFSAVIPWLILAATLLFALSGKLRTFGREHATPGIFTTRFLPLVFATAIYGGYFGAGIGIINLSLISLSGVRNLTQANAVKSLLGFGITGVACIPFILAHRIVWPLAGLMALGTVVGAYVSARVARHIPERNLRVGVVAIGLCVAAALFTMSKT